MSKWVNYGLIILTLLSFHIPRYQSYLTLHYPFGEVYKKPFGYIEGEEMKSKKTIVHCCHEFLVLRVCIPLSLGALCVLPTLAFAYKLAIERWRIEVVEDSISPVRRRANKGCHSCNLWFILIEISFPLQ